MDTLNNTSTLPTDWLGPRTSNVIFLFGLTLLVSGLSLIVTAAVMVYKSSNDRQKQKLRKTYMRHMSTKDQQDSSVNDAIPDQRPKTPTAPNANDDLDNVTGQHEYVSIPESGIWTPNRSEYMLEQNVTPEQLEGTGGQVIFYASSPIPSPEAVAHYDSIRCWDDSAPTV